MWRAVYGLTALVGLGFAAWIGFILVNGVRRRIQRINRERAGKRSLRGW
jgi:hypothetical protein